MRRRIRWYRYVWGELVPPTGIGLLLWTFLLLMNSFFLIAEKALAKNLGWDLTFRLFALEIPKLLIMSIPMAVLFGCLIAVGRLSADQEWNAIQSAGYGPSLLLRPLAVWGLGATLLCLGLYMWVVPRAHYAARNLHGEMIFLTNLASDLRPGAFYTQLPGTVLFVDNIRPASEGRLQGVMIHRSAAHGEGEQFTLARSGDIYPLADGSPNLAIVLREGVTYRYDPDDAETYQRFTFRRHSDVVEAPSFLSGLREAPTKSVYDMGPRELWAELERAESDPMLLPAMREVALRTARYALHRRLALSFASLLFALLALPLGVLRARSGKGAGFALSVVVILVYWVVFTASQAPALRGAIPAWLGAWSANLVIGPWAAVSYWRLRRFRGERRGLLVLLREALAAGAGAVTRRIARRSPAAARNSADESETEAGALAALGGTPQRFVGLIDQYIGRRFLYLLALSLASCYLIYAIVDLKRLLEEALRQQQPLSLVWRYLLYSLPGMAELAVPVSCLMAATVTFTLLARSGELTAIKAGGVNMRRTTVPVLALSGACCALLFFSQNYLTPPSTRRAEELKDQILRRAPVTYGMPAGGRWALGPEGTNLYHYRVYDPDRGLFQGLTVLTLDRAALRVLDHRFAPAARWDGARWHLDGGWHRSFPAGDAPWSYEQVEGEVVVALDPPESFTRREALLARGGDSLHKQMSAGEIRGQINDLDESGYDTTRLEVAYWGKLAQSLTPFVMVLLGLPFAFRIGRRGSLYGIGVALLLVIVYWATFAVFHALGLETILPPLLAAWTPNVFYALLGSYLLLYIGT